VSELQVIAQDLDGKAAALQAEQIPPLANSDTVQAPCGLYAAHIAAENLNRNARVLAEYQEWARAEKDRLAQSLSAAAAAYTKVDTLSEAAIEGGQPAGPISVTPDAPPPQPAPQVGAPPMASGSSDGSSSVPQTEADFNQPDQGASLLVAHASWTANALALSAVSATMHLDAVSWHSAAADAARQQFGQFGQWLGELGSCWFQLAGQADQIYAVHQRLRMEHEEIALRYAQARLNAELAMRSLDQQAAAAWYAEMHRLQEQSDQLRAEYGQQARVTTVTPPAPPTSSSGRIPVTSSPDARKKEPRDGKPDQMKGGGENPSSGGGSVAGGSGHPDQTGQPAAEPAVAPQSADSQPQSQGGSPQSGGGSPQSGGGSPQSGGGSPSPGGGSPGGMPGGLGGSTPQDPELPKQPEMTPAALGGGGAGGGGAGGGGGGGVPKMPLSPAVSAETVAPAPSPASAPAPAPTGATGHPTTGMGGMGGMPMGAHGGGQGQGKEKKRSAALSPDEELYTEDRAWTEAVIGNRRRKDVQEGREPK
jgi:hypothetical protein